jgi:hypothetical protein
MKCEACGSSNISKRPTEQPYHPDLHPGGWSGSLRCDCLDCGAWWIEEPEIPISDRPKTKRERNNGKHRHD